MFICFLYLFWFVIGFKCFEMESQFSFRQGLESEYCDTPVIFLFFTTSHILELPRYFLYVLQKSLLILLPFHSLSCMLLLVVEVFVCLEDFYLVCMLPSSNPYHELNKVPAFLRGSLSAVFFYSQSLSDCCHALGKGDCISDNSFQIFLCCPQPSVSGCYAFRKHPQVLWEVSVSSSDLPPVLKRPLLYLSKV